MNKHTTGRYYRISPRFWQDRDVRHEWTEDMRLLALYLLTAPHRNMAIERMGLEVLGFTGSEIHNYPRTCAQGLQVVKFSVSAYTQRLGSRKEGQSCLTAY